MLLVMTIISLGLSSAWWSLSMKHLWQILLLYSLDVLWRAYFTSVYRKKMNAGIAQAVWILLHKKIWENTLIDGTFLNKQTRIKKIILIRVLTYDPWGGVCVEVGSRFQTHLFKKVKTLAVIFQASQHCSKVKFKQSRVLLPEIQNSNEEGGSLWVWG